MIRFTRVFTNEVQSVRLSSQTASLARTKHTLGPRPGAAEGRPGGAQSRAKRSPQPGPVLAHPRSPRRSGVPPSDPGPSLDLLWLSAQQHTGSHSPEQPRGEHAWAGLSCSAPGAGLSDPSCQGHQGHLNESTFRFLP